MKRRYFFQDTKVNYADYLKIVETMLTHDRFFCGPTCIEKGVLALSKIDTKEKEEKLISSSVCVDRVFSEPGARNGNCARKTPIIMKMVDLIANNYDDVKDLTDQELGLVGYFFSVSEIDPNDKRFTLFTDKELLKEVINKTSSYYAQFEILSAIDSRYFELEIDKKEEDVNNFKKNMINTIKTNTKEEIIGMFNPEEKVLAAMDEVGFHM